MSDFFEWNDDITNEGSSFTIFPPGKYTATVTKVEKSRWSSAGQLNGCPYAAITLEVEGNGLKGIVTDNLFLYRKMEFKIANFLKAFGLKAKGEPVKASKIGDALHKKCIVTLECTMDKDHGYKKVSGDQLQSMIDSGENIYNNVKAYEPYEGSILDSIGIEVDEFNSDEFGF